MGILGTLAVLALIYYFFTWIKKRNDRIIQISHPNCSEIEDKLSSDLHSYHVEANFEEMYVNVKSTCLEYPGTTEYTKYELIVEDNKLSKWKCSINFEEELKSKIYFIKDEQLNSVSIEKIAKEFFDTPMCRPEYFSDCKSIEEFIERAESYYRTLASVHDIPDVFKSFLAHRYNIFVKNYDKVEVDL